MVNPLSQNRQKDEVLMELRRAVEELSPGGEPSSRQRKVGYFCSYVPPELLLAADVHPIRMTGIGIDDSSTGDAYMSHLTCSFARHTVSALVDGHYDFLDGEISLNTCDHMRMASNVIRAKSDLGFHEFLTVPRHDRPSLLSWYQEDLRRLFTVIAGHFEAAAGEESLEKAISRMNRVRKRVNEIDALRSQDPPLLSGAEAHLAFLAARLLLPEKFVQLADDLVTAAKRGEPIRDIRARVILYGGELDDARFIQTIERQGAHIAGDLLCFGARGLGNEIEPDGDPIERLARAYLTQIPCARMMGSFPHRYQELKKMVKERGAQGVVFQRIKFCQIWSNEVHDLIHRSQTEPLPLLVLDREYGTVSTGQIGTRVQGFLERIGM